MYCPNKEVEREIEAKVAEFLKVYSEKGANTGEVSLLTAIVEQADNIAGRGIPTAQTKEGMVCGIRRELFLFILRTIADPIGDGTMGRTPHPTHILAFSQEGFK